jgi:competence protein ComEC
MLEATPLVRAATELVSWVDHGAALLARITPVGRIAVTSVELGVMLVVTSLWLAARRERSRRDALVWAALCAGWALSRSPAPEGSLRVTFLDVGQGDAALIELPDGAVWLVDAGGNPNAPTARSARASGELIQRVLTAYDHSAIDLAIVSHPHPDHYLGLAAIDVPIAELWSAAELEPREPSRGAGPSFDDIVGVLAAEGTRATHPPLGVARTQAGVELTVYAPRYHGSDGAAVIGATDPVRSVNDNSLVVAIAYRGRRILFTGDLEREGEAELVAAGLPRFDVVKVPHHGSPTSSTPELVTATQPSLAVVSCGRGNRFGFPAPAVVERWRAVGADIARTDQHGAITVIVDEAGDVTVARAIDPRSN